MTITTSGNIGIGTTAPTTQLTIKKTIDSQAYGSGTRVMDFKTPYGNGIDEETVKASIYCGIPGAGSLRTDHGYLSFMTANTNTLYERLRIDQEGNIGIGTTAPSTRLHVVASGSGTNGSVLITGSDTFGHSLYIGSSAIEKRLAFNNNGTTGNIFAYNYGTLSSQNLVLQGPGGNVGIGTASPAQKLEVAGAIRISTSPSISYDGDASIVFNQAEVGPTIQGYQFDVRTGSATSRLRITNTGNVGIGNSSPSQILQVGNGGRLRIANSISDYSIIGTVDTDGSTNTRIVISGRDRSGTDTNGNIEYVATGTNGRHIFYTTDSTLHRMSINAAGNVGIGTSSPNCRLHIVGGASSNTIPTTGTGDTAMFSFMNIAYDGNSGYGLIGGVLASSGLVWLQSKYYHATNNLPMALQPLGGNLGVGTTVPGQSLDVQGNIGRVTYTDMHAAPSRFSQLIGRWDGSTSDDYFTGTKNVVTNGDGYANSSNIQWWTWANSISMSRDVGRIDHFGRNYNSSGTYAAYSDIKLKENIETARDYLDDVCQLRVVKYSLKSEHQAEADKLGFIAQEVEQIFPNLVNEIEVKERDAEGNETSNMIKTVKTSILIPMLVKCVQQIKSQLDQITQEFNEYKQSHP
jgi:hypothetical protein